MPRCDCGGRFFGPGAWHHARCKAQLNSTAPPRKRNLPQVKLTVEEERLAGNIDPIITRQWNDDRPGVN